MLKILSALAEVKKEIGTMTKDLENPFYKSRYFDINQLLEHVEPLIAKNGLLLLQPIKKGWVVTEIHDIKSGEFVSSEIEIGTITDPQKVGSAITFYRRYTLQSLLGIQAEDDDANTTVKTPQKTQSASEPTEWLNLFDKKGIKLKSFDEIQSAINDGKKFTLIDIRKKYKVSKVVAEELKTNFNIQ